MLKTKGEIGLFFFKIRKEMGISQGEFARKFNMPHQTTVGKIENGKRYPTPETLVAFSNNREISIDYILTGENFIPEKTNEMDQSKFNLMEENRKLRIALNNTQEQLIDYLRTEKSDQKDQKKTASNFG